MDLFVIWTRCPIYEEVRCEITLPCDIFEELEKKINKFRS